MKVNKTELEVLQRNLGVLSQSGQSGQFFKKVKHDLKKVNNIPSDLDGYTSVLLKHQKRVEVYKITETKTGCLSVIKITRGLLWDTIEEVQGDDRLGYLEDEFIRTIIPNKKMYSMKPMMDGFSASLLFYPGQTICAATQKALEKAVLHQIKYSPILLGKNYDAYELSDWMTACFVHDVYLVDEDKIDV